MNELPIPGAQPRPDPRRRRSTPSATDPSPTPPVCRPAGPWAGVPASPPPPPPRGRSLARRRPRRRSSAPLVAGGTSPSPPRRRRRRRQIGAAYRRRRRESRAGEAADGAVTRSHDLVPRAEPSIVGDPRRLTQTDVFGQQLQGQAAGSGFVLSADGYIVTNNHVDRRGRPIKVELDDGTTEDATVVAADPNPTSPCCKVDRTDLTPLAIGDSAMHPGRRPGRRHRQRPRPRPADRP